MIPGRRRRLAAASDAIHDSQALIRAESPAAGAITGVSDPIS
jgi:hypothetical protein